MARLVTSDELHDAENGFAGHHLGPVQEESPEPSDSPAADENGALLDRTTSYAEAVEPNSRPSAGRLAAARPPPIQEELVDLGSSSTDSAPADPTHGRSRKGRTSAAGMAAARAVARVREAEAKGETAYTENSDAPRKVSRAHTIGHGPASSTSAPGSSTDLTGNKPGVPLVRVSNSVDDLSPTRSNSMYTVRRTATCTSQSFHNEMSDLIPELREHRAAALHESRTSIGRCMSSHTKTLLTLSLVNKDGVVEEVDAGSPHLLRWRSLEDLDLTADKRPTSAREAVDVHTNKKRGTMAAEAAFHPRGTQSDHEASSSESEEGKSSDEEEDMMLERILEKDLEEHGIALSPTTQHQAARLHKAHHRTRHSDAVQDQDVEAADDEDDELEGLNTVRHRSGFRIPGVDDVDDVKAKQKNIHLVLSSMRRSISELVLIADSLDVRVRASAQHLRKCSYNLLESMVSVKEHIYEHIHLLKYRQVENQYRGRGLLAELRLQHGGRSRFYASQNAGSPRRPRGTSTGSRSSKDSESLNGSILDKFPAGGFLRRNFGLLSLAVIGIFVIIVLFLASGNQPHVPHDPLAHVYYASDVVNGSVPFDQDEPFDWVELHVRLPDVENNHGGHDREAVVFQLESRPKGGGAWVPTGHGSERCRQGKSGLRLCFFEGFTNLDTSQEYHFAYHLENQDPSHHGSIPFEAHVIQMGQIGFAKLWLCAIILIGALVTIAKEWIHRTLVAFVGSSLVLGLLLWCNLFPDLQTVVEWIDEETLGLLFGMMIIVGRLAETGFFQVATARVLPYSKQSTFRLVIILCVLTGVLSAFLDNVTTMILLAPITIEMTQALQIDPKPFLIAETLFSNVGGAATQIGDPPNIIIGSSFPEISFVDFLANMLPGILIMYGPLLVFLRWQYKKELTGKLEHFNDGLEVAQQYVITDWPLLQKSLLVLGLVLLAFVTHSIHHVNPAWAAVMGAVALMLASNPHEIDHALESVEWDVLLFFAALFIMVEGVAELGFIRFIGGVFQAAIEPAPEENHLTVAISLLLWISAVVSAFLDNIPYTATMIPVIAQLADEDDGLGLDLTTLAWALGFGACLGGNGSLIGASANIVVSSISHRYGHEISFNQFIKVSFPFMLVSVAFAHVYMLARYR